MTKLALPAPPGAEIQPPMHGSRLRALGAAAGIAVFFCLAAFPADSVAATASIDIKRVYYIAGPGEANDLKITLSGTLSDGNFVLTDPKATIAAGAGCTAAGSTATCPSAGIIGITVNGADGGDNLVVDRAISTPATISGGNGDDLLQGGSGNDVLRGNQGIDTHDGGAGDDLIDSRGNRGDLVNCGAGTDTVQADAADVVAKDCEIVERDSPPPGGPSPTGTGLLGPDETRRLDPGACAQDMLGTPEDDLLAGTPLGDSVFGLQGDDKINGEGGDDCLFGGLGSDRLSGSGGDDHLLGDDRKKGFGGNDRLYGNAGNDVLWGGPGKDRLRGGKGKDRLSGGPGRNSLLGGPGNDRIYSVNGKTDRVNCGRGRDRVTADRRDRVRGCERVRRRR
jgi:Ca2+-binding RTX toxin-like protein